MSMTATFSHPPATRDLRPEQPDRVEKWLDRTIHSGLGYWRRLPWGRREINGLLAEIEAAGPDLGKLSDEELKRALDALRHELHADGFAPRHVVKSFALIREQSTRVLGMRHYGSQLSGALVMLRGMVAEMETGEGKTLTATLTAATAALAGIPVHVISVNDYLTSRDADTMEPLYRSLGLSVGRVLHGQTPEERRLAYQCPITYATNKELVFDYLRDRLVLGERPDPIFVQTEYLHGGQPRSKRLLMRGLHFAIVDEADSVLVDEARTPLIISGTADIPEEQEFFEQALELAANLQVEDDYVIDAARRQLYLTDAGRQRIADLTRESGPLWSGLVRRESTVNQALTAIHLFHRDEQYLLRDGKVQIIDEFTGRVMADRSWEQGLHQMIELKEGCEMTRRREPLAKISYQRFFRRYLMLSGMTGTAREVAGELWSVYHLPTLRVSTHKPVIRKRLADRIFATREEKWLAVVARTAELHRQGRPVLIGTRSVAASEQLAQLVRQAGLAHQLLNAKQDAEEAAIISTAGSVASITIATNMAGRGTDIILGNGVREMGGLHVIITERHEAARIDRQLAGRCGRQGDPGSFEAILSLEDFLFEGGHGGPLAALARQLAINFPVAKRLLSRWATHMAQQRLERYHSRVRKALFLQDQTRGSLLSFSGRLE